MLTVQDDGRGIDPLAPKGLGSLGMKERVEGLGGDYALESERGRGTSLRVVIPLRAKENDARRSCQTGTKGEFSKVLVKGHEDPRLFFGTPDNFSIRRSGAIRAHPNYVMAASPQSINRIARKILVGQDSHEAGET